MAPLFPRCDYEHRLIVVDKPGGNGATIQQMIRCYIQTVAKVIGSGSWYAASRRRIRGSTRCPASNTLGSAVRLMRRSPTIWKKEIRIYSLGGLHEQRIKYKSDDH